MQYPVPSGVCCIIKRDRQRCRGPFIHRAKGVFGLFCEQSASEQKRCFTIQPEKAITKEYAFDGNPQIEVHLLDADTKQQLDKAVVKQNKARDLGGLI